MARSESRSESLARKPQQRSESHVTLLAALTISAAIFVAFLSNGPVEIAAPAAGSACREFHTIEECNGLIQEASAETQHLAQAFESLQHASEAEGAKVPDARISELAAKYQGALVRKEQLEAAKAATFAEQASAKLERALRAEAALDVIEAAKQEALEAESHAMDQRAELIDALSCEPQSVLGAGLWWRCLVTASVTVFS